MALRSSVCPLKLESPDAATLKKSHGRATTSTRSIFEEVDQDPRYEQEHERYFHHQRVVLGSEERKLSSWVSIAKKRSVVCVALLGADFNNLRNGRARQILERLRVTIHSGHALKRVMMHGASQHLQSQLFMTAQNCAIHVHVDALQHAQEFDTGEL